MYYFELFDAVMFGIMMVLLIAFAVSITHATMKVKLEGTLNHYIVRESALRESNMQLLQQWSEASTYMYAVHDCAAMLFCYNPKDPAIHQLAQILRVSEQMALDPAISRGANQLINKAKREHGKKVRKAADRKLERVEREYEQRLQLYKDSLESAQGSNSIIRGNLGEIRAELSAFQSIVGQELENFVRLPSVRNKMLAAINQKHKAWKEL